MAGQVFDLAVVVWRDLTIPSHSGKSLGSEVGAGIFLHLFSLRILGSVSSSADRSRLREGGMWPPASCLLSGQSCWFPKPVSCSPGDRNLSQQQAVRVETLLFSGHWKLQGRRQQDGRITVSERRLQPVLYCLLAYC